MQKIWAYILIFFIIFIPTSIISVLADINIVFRWFIFLSGLYTAGMIIFNLNESFHKNYTINTVLQSNDIQTIDGKICFCEDKVPVKANPDRVFFTNEGSRLDRAEVRYGCLRSTEWILYITTDDLIAIANI